MKEKILYGVRIGEPKYMEEILTEDETKIEKAMEWGKANGFDRFRIAEIDFSVPHDFTKIFNK